MGLLGILVGLGLLIWLAFRGWSVLLLAPAAALLAALFGGEPLLANWTQIFGTKRDLAPGPSGISTTLMVTNAQPLLARQLPDASACRRLWRFQYSP